MFKNNFTSGELGPNLWARSDLAQFQNGCARAQNFIPQIEGPLRRRAGFWLAGTAAVQATATRLVPYVRAVDDAYVIELGHLKTRFWAVDGTAIRVTGTPYEVVSPYTAADLAGLRWKQLGNTILFLHADGRKPKRLEKVSETSWNWADYTFDDGPWQAENTTQSDTISATDWRAGQTVTLTRPSGGFVAGMIGTYMRFRAATGVPGLRTWQADEDPNGFALRLSGGRVYYTSPEATTQKAGNTPPSHDIGTVSDGNLDWTYLHDNSGVVKIASYISPTEVTALVVRNLPTVGQYDSEHEEWRFESTTVPPTHGLAFPATFAWAFAAYSDYFGWPTAWPELRDERLIVAGGKSSVDKYHASQAAGYYPGHASFSPGLGTGAILDDDGITGFVGDDSFKAMWLVSGPMLVCGTHGGESVIVGATGEAPLTPDGAKPRALTRYGSADVKPVKAQDSILFVTRGAKSLRDLTVSSYDYPGQGADLSFWARHIAERGFAELAYAAAPDYLLWCRMADGSLASLVYNREQGIKGWSGHVLGGGLTVESLCVVPDASGNDRLWIVASRTKDAATQRLVLWMSDPDDRMRLDAAVRYLGTDTATVDGAGHLEGETVTAMIGPGTGDYASGGAGLVVEDGEVTLAVGQTAAEIIVGLPYVSRFESLPLSANNAQGQRLKVQAVTVAVEGVRFAAGDVAASRGDVFQSRDFNDTNVLRPAHLVERLTMAGDDALDPRVYVQADDGFDLIVKSVNLELAR